MSRSGLEGRRALTAPGWFTSLPSTVFVSNGLSAAGTDGGHVPVASIYSW